MTSLQREPPIANGSFLVVQSPSGQQSFVAARSVPKAVLRRHDLAAEKLPSSFARGGRPIVTTAEIPNE